MILKLWKKNDNVIYFIPVDEKKPVKICFDDKIKINKISDFEYEYINEDAAAAISAIFD